MAEQVNSFSLINIIPFQVVNEGASYGPLYLTEFIEVPEAGGKVRFQAELTDGRPLPKGLICTSEGMVSGIPAVGTNGVYDIRVKVTNEESDIFETQFSLSISSRIVLTTGDAANQLKTQVWEALAKNLPIPEFDALLDRPISVVEMYYLLQRFGVLTVWDVYNLEMPAEKKLLQLEGVSKHYNVYDRGSCLIGAPKDLFSHERTLEDALQTSRAMAREVYKRNWTIELAGFNKMVRGAWVELQHLGDKNGRHVDILHFDPSSDDMRVYTEQARAIAAASMGM